VPAIPCGIMPAVLVAGNVVHTKGEISCTWGLVETADRSNDSFVLTASEAKSVLPLHCSSKGEGAVDAMVILLLLMMVLIWQGTVFLVSVLPL